MASAYKMIDSSVRAEFFFEYSFVNNAIRNGFYVSNIHLTTIDSIEYGFQHELNHIHKSKYIHTTNSLYYANIIKTIFNTTNDKVLKDIAFILYSFCIPDERNAYIEQFYTQYTSLPQRQRDYKNTEHWKEFNKYYNWLNTKQNVIETKSQDIFNLFKDITKYYLNINYNKMTDKEYTKILIEKLKEELKKAERKYIRTTFIPESYFLTDYGKLLTYH